MLIANGRLYVGGSTSIFGLDEPYFMPQDFTTKFLGGIPRLASVPAGYSANGINPCLTAGGMASRISPAMTFSGAAPINKGISITASGGALQWSGSAALGAIVKLVASGGFKFSGQAGMFGVASMAANGQAIHFSGSAALGGQFSITASGRIIQFGGSATTHSLAHLGIATATGNLTPADLTALANAVWEALTVSHQTTGSMGKAMSAAGSAGDPWSTPLPGTYTGTQAGALLENIRLLAAEMHTLQALDVGTAVTATPTGITAGTIQIGITGDGITTATSTRTA